MGLYNCLQVSGSRGRSGMSLLLYFHPLLFVEVFFSFFLFILFHGVSVKSDIIKLSLLSGLNHSLSPRSI